MSGVTTLPALVLEVDGLPLAAEDGRALGAAQVVQRLSLPTLCELVYYDPPASSTITDRLQPGAALRVLFEDDSLPLFVGQVTAVEHVYGPTAGYEVRVRGYDLLHRLRKRQQVRAHVQVTVRDLAQELVADVGLRVQAAESGPLWSRLYQHRQSDLELLVEATELCGLYFTARENELHLCTLAGVESDAPLPLELGASLLEARLEVNGDPAGRSVTATGWNPLRVEVMSGQAEAARSGRAVGTAVLPDLLGSMGHRELVDERTPAADHAEGLAQAELDRRWAGEVTLWGVAQGDPRLRPGAVVDVAGVAASLAGRYVLTEVTHTIDARRGYLSELSTAPPPPRRRPVGAVATLGVVTQVNDPDNLGRIQVRLPTYGDVESDWLGVLAPAGGKGKGLIALPDVNDHVLVLLTHEDPGSGLVLGGLYGMDGPPDSGVENGAVRRYTFLTPGGQRVQLNDAANTLRLENSAGSFVELSPEKVHLHAGTTLEIEAPGQSIVIRGQTIDFQKG